MDLWQDQFYRLAEQQPSVARGIRCLAWLRSVALQCIIAAQAGALPLFPSPGRSPTCWPRLRWRFALLVGRSDELARFAGITIRPRVFVEYRPRAILLRVTFLLVFTLLTPYDPSNDSVFIGGAVLVDRG